MSLTDPQIARLVREPSRMPPSAALLGFEMLAYSIEEGWADVAFMPRREFLNPIGNVQGGFVSAMLDDAMGVAASLHTRSARVVPTLQLNVVFLNPLPLVRVLGRGEVVRMGRNTALLAGRLTLEDGTPIATATASAAVRDFPAKGRTGSDGKAGGG